MIDDGPWTGLPIGGLGAGSIGRTYRGDFRRWHLTIGEHRVESVPFAAFSVVVLGRDPGAGPGAGPAAEADSGAGAGAAPGFVPRWATVLSAARPDDPRGWAWELRPGDGTYHALMPRAWFEYRPDGAPIRIVEEQLAPLIPGDYEASALPVGVVTFTVENPTAEPLTVGVMLSWPDILAREKGVGGPSEQRVVPTVGPGHEGVGGEGGDGREGVGGEGGDGAGADGAGRDRREPLSIAIHSG
ncbi:MAG TPA: GH116 family glycosyl-hydrolase, partial [Candidatus Limnocylindrales bacterium]|nr:GH116 family glycosyl-hydrolase [Candidatus Limnocylindrales bacterium]